MVGRTHPMDMAAKATIKNCVKVFLSMSKVFTVVGHSGSGKTTLVEKLLRELSGRGLRVATIKHAHHKVVLDTPGKDSFRYKQAAALHARGRPGRRRHRHGRGLSAVAAFRAGRCRRDCPVHARPEMITDCT